MNLKKLSIDLLNPAPYNPRVKLKPGDARWNKLARSLEEFDLVQPIIWNSRTGNVVGGHQRLQILKHRGDTEIDCVVVDLPLEREKALNVTLNNASVGSEWEADQLVNLISELQELPDFDATLTGFDAQQLKDLVLRPEDSFNSLDNSEIPPESKGIHVTLEIDESDWEEIEERLNAVLADFPATRLHLRR
ncbi:ParB N-terminal domain-containing protein [Planctomicrobium sp. SH668]|uniref:ParB N-terminal domain-containing protein n=1 Tax=Planctomicrobium sp. SH668 TaxID=3448126 RepID=UPI003F5C99BB